mmetsp:Transcript_56396/g.134640  ORF Transcript_56396/g.134640 Transcript_56396/m.134640 type:complete len:242 (-) Transcript_56396:536-1261(-)
MLEVQVHYLDAGCRKTLRDGLSQGLGMTVSAGVHHEDFEVSPGLFPQLLLSPGFVLCHQLPALIPHHWAMQRSQLRHIRPTQGLAKHEDLPHGRGRPLGEEVTVEQMIPVLHVCLPAFNPWSVERAIFLANLPVRTEELTCEEASGERIEGRRGFRQLLGWGQHEAHHPAGVELEPGAVLDGKEAHLPHHRLRQLLLQGQNYRHRSVDQERIPRSLLNKILNEGDLPSVEELQHQHSDLVH